MRGAWVARSERGWRMRWRPKRPYNKHNVAVPVIRAAQFCPRARGWALSGCKLHHAVAVWPERGRSLYADFS